MSSIFFDLTILSSLWATFFHFLCFLIKPIDNNAKGEHSGKADAVERNYLSSRKILSFFGSVSIFLCSICGFLYIVHRWKVSGSPPFTTTFEVLFLFAWSIATIYSIFLSKKYTLAPIIEAFISLFILIILAYSTLLDTRIKPLLPALQNNFWLTVHVILCFVSYAGFTIAFIIAMIYLLGSGKKNRYFASFLLLFTLSGLTLGILIFLLTKMGKVNLQNFGRLSSKIALFIAANTTLTLVTWISLVIIPAKKDILWEQDKKNTLEQLIYRITIVSFSFLTFGIVSGAVWANEVWGAYWSWDPKETWSLITWLVYLLYLHLRFMHRWQGVRLAWVIVLGFYSILFTFLGVNYFLPGLHSYI